MRYVDFCGKRASMLGFGCGSVLGRVGRGASLRAMDAAWAAGVTLFDTARSYGYGDAEGLLGSFLAGRREQAVIVTKFGILPQPLSAWKRWARPVVRGLLHAVPQMRGHVRRGIAGHASPGHFDVSTLRRSLSASLRALRTDYVDALLLHEAPATAMAQEDLIAELEALIAAGKIRRAGIASSVEVIAGSWTLWPRALQVLQFPSNFLAPSHWEQYHLQGRFTMVNHPFGGAVQSAQSLAAMKAMRNDLNVEASLREKLQGDLHERLAEIVFGTTLRAANAQAVVTSMLRPENIRANAAALDSPRFSFNEMALVRQRIVASRENV